MAVGGRKAKIASRERTTGKETRRYFSTRKEDVLHTLPDGRIIARDDQGGFYLTEARYIGSPLADPNRYGRPSSRLTEEDLRALTGEAAGAEA